MYHIYISFYQILFEFLLHKFYRFVSDQLSISYRLIALAFSRMFSTSLFEIRTPDQVGEEMTKFTEECARKLCAEFPKFAKCWEPIVRNLLSEFAWDYAELHRNVKFTWSGVLDSRYLGAFDPECPDFHDFAVKFSRNEGECEVCGFSVDARLRSLNCSHFYCIDCWSKYLLRKIFDDGSSRISCAHTDCVVLLDDFRLAHLIVPRELKRAEKRFRELCINDFIMKRYHSSASCPSTACEHIALLKADKRQQNNNSNQNAAVPIHCACGTSYCSACRERWHAPASCELVRAWKRWSREMDGRQNDGNDGDIASEQWKSANSRQCPNCEYSIEKADGCNHMTCRRRQCGHEFCWLCLSPWRGHPSGSATCARQSAELVAQQTQRQAELHEKLRVASIRDVFTRCGARHAQLQANLGNCEEYRAHFRHAQQHKMDHPCKYGSASMWLKKLCLALSALSHTAMLAFFTSRKIADGTFAERPELVGQRDLLEKRTLRALSLISTTRQSPNDFEQFAAKFEEGELAKLMRKIEAGYSEFMQFCRTQMREWQLIDLSIGSPTI